MPVDMRDIMGPEDWIRVLRRNLEQQHKAFLEGLKVVFDDHNIVTESGEPASKAIERGHDPPTCIVCHVLADVEREYGPL